jgi:uncharacterized protein YijF (DUF1287 family)
LFSYYHDFEVCPTLCEFAPIQRLLLLYFFNHHVQVTLLSNFSRLRNWVEFFKLMASEAEPSVVIADQAQPVADAPVAPVKNKRKRGTGKTISYKPGDVLPDGYRLVQFAARIDAVRTKPKSISAEQAESLALQKTLTDDAMKALSDPVTKAYKMRPDDLRCSRQLRLFAYTARKNPKLGYLDKNTIKVQAGDITVMMPVNGRNVPRYNGAAKLRGDMLLKAADKISIGDLARSNSFLRDFGFGRPAVREILGLPDVPAPRPSKKIKVKFTESVPNVIDEALSHVSDFAITSPEVHEQSTQDQKDESQSKLDLTPDSDEDCDIAKEDGEVPETDPECVDTDDDAPLRFPNADPEDLDKLAALATERKELKQMLRNVRTTRRKTYGS